jgi:phosphoribosyl-AMP cyclohydrolase
LKTTIIYQDIWSKRIARLESRDSLETIFQIEHTYFVDCDKDTLLIQKPLPPDPELGRIIHSENISFNHGLIPVIAQDPLGVVLMQAFTDPKALELSLETGYAHYYSRSREKLWKKGEDSGHVQKISIIEYSPLYHYLVYRVEQVKGACHTGYYSCFFEKFENSKFNLVYNEKIFEPEKVYAK